jgi:TolB protein
MLMGLWASPMALAQDDSQGLEYQNPSVVIPVDLSGTFNRYAVAIPSFLPLRSGGAGEGAWPIRLGKNLDMTGYFQLLDPRASLEVDPRAGIASEVPFDYVPWARIGANFVIKGGVEVSGSRLVMELRLFDVAMGVQKVAKRYSGSVKDARSMINRFTNEVILAVTGQPGVFGSKIIFVTGERSTKGIMMTELGADEAESIAGPKNGPATQPALGPGNKTAWIHRNGKRWELVVGGRVQYSGEQVIAPAFTPGGSVVAGLSGPNSTNLAVFEGRTPRQITFGGGIEISPSFSPDGGRMVFVSNQGGTAGLYVSSSSGGSGSRLSPGGKSTDPHWSPKGDKIAFVLGERDICVINSDGSGFTQLTGGQGSNLHPSFSPDGRMIVFSSTRNGREQLFVMAANGDRQQPLIPDVPGSQSLPYWSPVMPE